MSRTSHLKRKEDSEKATEAQSSEDRITRSDKNVHK